MKKLLGSLLSLALVATVVTGCGGSSRDTSTIRVAVGGDCAYLDPAIVDDSITANVLNQMYEGLYKLDTNGNVVANVATAKPTISKDGKTYTITLNKGYKWSDGQALTAKDYVYAWKRAAAMGAATAYYSNFIYNYVTGAGDGSATTMSKLSNFGAVAKDDYTIQITLKKKCAYFTSLMANTVFYPVRQSAVEKKGANPLKSTWADATDVPTNGAFTATAINAKSEIDLAKNDKYHAASEVKIKKISFKVMSDTDSETSGFQSGELDFATACNNETIQANSDLKKQVYTVNPFVCNYYILINSGDENTNKALKDVDIRNALGLAIDKKKVVEASGYGSYAYALDQFVPKGIPGATGDYNTEDTTAYSTFNLAEAQKIMKSKGYSASHMLTLTYKYNDLPLHKDVAQVLQSCLKKAYVNLELKTEEKETFFADRDKGNFELARHAMTADYLDPMAYLSMYYGNDLAGNTVDDDTYNAMIKKAETMDGAARMKQLHAAEKYLVQTKHYIIPLFGYTEPYLKASELKGVTSSPEGHYNLTRAYYK